MHFHFGLVISLLIFSKVSNFPPKKATLLGIRAIIIPLLIPMSIIVPITIFHRQQIHAIKFYSSIRQPKINKKLFTKNIVQSSWTKFYGGVSTFPIGGRNLWQMKKFGNQLHMKKYKGMEIVFSGRKEWN